MHRKVWFHVVSALLALIVSSVSLEATYRLWLRIRYGSLPELSNSLYLPRPAAGGDTLPIRLKPGGKVERDGRRITIGRYGVRNGKIEATPGLGPVVMVVGGSSVFGTGLGDESTGPALLESELSGLAGWPVYAVNGGVPGYTTAEVRIRARELVSVFHPAVVVVVEAFNDVKRVAGSTIRPMTYPEWRTWSAERWAVPPWWRRSDVLDRLLKRPRADWGFFGNDDGKVAALPPGYEQPYLDELLGLAQETQNAGSLFVYGVQPLNLTAAGLLATDTGTRAMGVNLWPLTPEAGVKAFLGLQTAAAAALKGRPVADFSAGFRDHPGYFSDHVHLTESGSREWGSLMAATLAGMPEVDLALGLTRRRD